jgi:catechol 2,3-dioxygenase-like lactoylglutathione lyase family enzyme
MVIPENFDFRKTRIDKGELFGWLFTIYIMIQIVVYILAIIRWFITDHFSFWHGFKELTYNWDPEEYTGGRNFGHLAYSVKNIYETCDKLMKNGVTINRPPRDGHMAFIKSPDGISIEILQEGEALPIKKPWQSMENSGTW